MTRRFARVAASLAIFALGAAVFAQAPRILLTSRTSLLLGQNRFDVEVRNIKSEPIAGADVSVSLTMPAMPAINHPEMKTGATLKPSGSGKYSGIVMVPMAGAWNGEIVVRKSGTTIGRTSVVLKAYETEKARRAADEAARAR